jgi:hypothetical protein
MQHLIWKLTDRYGNSKLECHQPPDPETCMYVCLFFYWLCMLHYSWVMLHAISYIVSYQGYVLCFTHFESPLRYMVFVIVGQNLLILKRLEMSPSASWLGAVCLQACWLLWHSNASRCLMFQFPYVCMYVCTYIRTCVCIMYVCMHVYVYVCMYVFFFIFIFFIIIK